MSRIGATLLAVVIADLVLAGPAASAETLAPRHVKHPCVVVKANLDLGAWCRPSGTIEDGGVAQSG
jgi:hypothetical protein